MELLKERINTRYNRLCDTLHELIRELVTEKFPINSPVVLPLMKICGMLEEFWDLFNKSLLEREKASTFFLETELELEERINTRLNRLRDILRDLIGDLDKHQFPIITPVFLSLIKICDIVRDFWDLFDKSLPERERFLLELESNLEGE